MKVKKLFGEIQKVHDQDDGTIIVEGVASTQDQDSDGETITSDAMKSAIPDYMKFGAVREMHQAKAAGTALNIDVADTGITNIKAHIVDSEAIKKVKSGVYKGFSVGGSVTKRDDLNKTIITGISLIEVSLVDRPANPNAVITCYKADGIAPEQENEQLEKSFYSVAKLARLLDEVQDFCSHVEYEDQYQQRNTEIPSIVKTAALSLSEALQALVNNEIANLQKSDIAKEESMRGMDELKKSVEHLTDLVSKALPSSESTVSKSDDATQEQVEKSETTDELQKVRNDLDVVKADLSKITRQRDDLQKRVSELESEPEPGKAVIRDLSKSDDTPNAKAEIDPILDSNGEVNELATMIKAAQSQRI